MTPAQLVPNVAYRQPYWILPDRRVTMASAAALAVLFIAVMTGVLDSGGRTAQLLLDRSSTIYPFTIQNF